MWLSSQVASEVSKALRKEAGKGCTSKHGSADVPDSSQVHYTVDEKQRQCVLIEVGAS